MNSHLATTRYFGPYFTVFVMGLLCVLTGCHDHTSSGPSEHSSQVAVGRDDKSNQQIDESTAKYDRALEKALGHADKLREESIKNSASNQINLPNFSAGPGTPRPTGRNFYELDQRNPTYLLCIYDVSENHYDETNEPEWFKASLQQIRGIGNGGFPPVKWFAVAIVNRAEHKGPESFEQSFKVGAIFNAIDVFNQESNLKRLIAQVAIDRHPFKYDPNGSPSQRWIIVEQHAATH